MGLLLLEEMSSWTEGLMIEIVDISAACKCEASI